MSQEQLADFQHLVVYGGEAPLGTIAVVETRDNIVYVRLDNLCPIALSVRQGQIEVSAEYLDRSTHAWLRVIGISVYVSRGDSFYTRPIDLDVLTSRASRGVIPEGRGEPVKKPTKKKIDPFKQNRTALDEETIPKLKVNIPSRRVSSYQSLFRAGVGEWDLSETTELRID